MKKNLPNIYLVIFSIVVLVVLVMASFLFWDEHFKKAVFGKRAYLKSALTQGLRKEGIREPEVKLSFVSKDKVFKSRKTFEVEVMIDTRERETWGADLRLIFDPRSLIVEKVLPGAYFDNPLTLENLIDEKEGEISFSVGSLTAAKGKGVLAVLKVKLLEKGETTLSFSPETQVALKGKEEPAVIDYQDLVFEVKE